MAISRAADPKGSKREAEYVPALRFGFLTPLYDRLVSFGLPEGELRGRLLEEAHLAPGETALEVGCGTASLAVLAAASCPGALVVGLDGDPAILGQAREKVGSTGVRLVCARAPALPFRPGSFDHVFASLFLHHLSDEEKRATLAAVLALLKPGGRFHVADWGEPADPLQRLAFLSVRCLDGFSRTRDHALGLLPQKMREAGFADVEETGMKRTWFGTLRFYTARRPVDTEQKESFSGSR
ncbi:MAG: hypothetical protein KatS3mg076_2512 [Candidatus Binatia bacterium]|nr:MAG: hypothetical protein KatS3mg076_2512 [Candidatus Binatia bacterium]